MHLEVERARAQLSAMKGTSEELRRLLDDASARQDQLRRRKDAAEAALRDLEGRVQRLRRRLRIRRALVVAAGAVAIASWSNALGGTMLPALGRAAVRLGADGWGRAIIGLIVVGVGGGWYQLRNRYPFGYGCAEIAFGVAGGIAAAEATTELGAGATMVAGLYVVVRGFDNVAKATNTQPRIPKDLEEKVEAARSAIETTAAQFAELERDGGRMLAERRAGLAVMDAKRKALHESFESLAAAIGEVVDQRPEE